MTDTEAKKIAAILKAGKSYKQGHYQYGYESFEYDENAGSFKYIREDTGLDWLNPDRKEVFLTEKEFLKKIIENFDYGDFIQNLI
jgi:hypothetical protein